MTPPCPTRLSSGLTYGAARARIVVTHGGQDKAPPHLAGRTGLAGADRDAREIERHDLGFGLDSGHGKAARIADARRLRSRNRDVRDLSARAAFQHVAELRDSIRARSEEHTSELQSLMRISYAVFCLKKKKP